MFSKQSKRQTGFALLIFLLVMMGFGGVALTGVAKNALKQVEDKKFRHNESVLKEAKQALLMFAYNYPVTHPGQGPGRLPCPYDQIPFGGGSGYSGTISNAICEAVGRMPWKHNDFELPEFKDADGEHLWYAVSKNFDNLATPIVNSDTTGTITIKDQTGNIIYDGGASGIAAVIIAPGPAIIIDDDNNGSLNYQQVRNRNDPTDTVNFEPKNFLDSAYGGTALSENNFRFINYELDGFIPGPIVDGNNTLLMNDQIIIIRAEEVIAMAEKATLDAYRTAIKDYLANTGGVYPWLYNYNPRATARCVGGISPERGITQAICFSNGGNWEVVVENLNSLYPALANFNDPDNSDDPLNPEDNGELIAYLGNVGRIPSMFQDYFTDGDGQPIDSKLSVSLSLTYPVMVEVGFNQTFPEVTGGDFLFNNASIHTIDIQTADRLTNLMFDDIEPDIVPNYGSLSGNTVVTTELFTDVLYFWDDKAAPDLFWKICPAGGDQLSDCDRTGGDPTPGAGNDTIAHILRVVVELDFTTPRISFGIGYSNPPIIAPIVAASGASHAQISATFAGNDIIEWPVSVKYEVDRNYLALFVAEEEGTLDITDLTRGPVTLAMRYYPILPDWAFGNGWHNSIMMAYANDNRPDVLGNDCLTNGPCIQINGTGGTIDNKISILTLAGQHNWNADEDNDYTNDLPKIFDIENDDLDNIYDARVDGGNDRIRVIDECAAGLCP